jgi:hypothetical protein
LSWILDDASNGDPRDGGTRMNFFLGKDGISTLWAQAVEWGLDKENRPKIEYRRFRDWWLRAAMARGHAQWLLDERRNQPGKCTFSSRIDLIDMPQKSEHVRFGVSDSFLYSTYILVFLTPGIYRSYVESNRRMAVVSTTASGPFP